MWSQVQLAGWNGPRRVILLRRPLRPEPVVAKRPSQRRAAQMELELGWIQEGTVLYVLYVLYEHPVLVTNMAEDIFTLAQHYRDRGDAENNFDELKKIGKLYVFRGKRYITDYFNFNPSMYKLEARTGKE